jgi:hypothetical protein
MMNRQPSKFLSFLRRWLPVAGLWLAGLGLRPDHAAAQGWETYAGGNKEDFGHCVIQATDLGFAVTGYSESYGTDGDMDVFLVRTDVDGRERWVGSYDDGFIEHGYSLLETPDLGFLVAGDIRQTPQSAANVYLLKTDRDGAKEWSQQYGGPGTDVAYRIIPTPAAGGYLMVGWTDTDGNSPFDVLLVKVNAQGAQEWIRSFGNPDGNDFGRSVVALDDGYLVAGTGLNPQTGSQDILLLRTDPAGDLLWQQYYGENNDIDEGHDLVLHPDGHVYLTGYKGSMSDAFLLKLLPDGTEIWSSEWGGSLGDQAFDLAVAANGDLALTGITEISATNSDAFLARADTAGNLLWWQPLGRGNHVDLGQSLTSTQDGGFAVTGYNSLFGTFLNDLTLTKTGPTGLVYTNHLQGKVFLDDGDCVLSGAEPGLQRWIIRASSPDKTFFASTDESGFFDMVTDTGDYTLSVLQKNNYWSPCITGYNVSFSTGFDTLVRHFPILPEHACPLLEVDVSTAVAQSCSNIGYVVQFCNSGTEPADEPVVHLVLDNDLSFVSASLPPTAQVDSLLVFEPGALGLDACGQFELTVASSCTGPNGQAYSVSAHIFPDSVCTPASPSWDMASVQVDGYCDGDSIRFTLTNQGSGDMGQALDFIVIEDQILGLQGDFILSSGASRQVSLPAGGATLRLVAEQSPGHPGNSYPTVAVEGCSQGSSFSTGFVSQFQEDENNPFLSVDVRENNDTNTTDVVLRGYPKGYYYQGANLLPAHTALEYHLSFRHTGDDTLRHLVIRDTVPAALDIATVVAGAGSHPYSFEAYGSGVLKFTFEDLDLPPGATGFVQFKISQRPGNPTGTLIENRALAFPDYLAPQETNTYVHKVGGATLTDFLVISDLTQSVPPGSSVVAYPNPFADAVTFELTGPVTAPQRLSVRLYDLLGQVVSEANGVGTQVRLPRGQLPAGAYLYVLSAEGQTLDTGKIIVR